MPKQMSDFKAKMHKIRFLLGLPKTPLGELTAPPDLLTGFKGPTSKGRAGGGRGEKRERKGEREGDGKVRRRGRECGGEGRGGGGKGSEGGDTQYFLPGLTPLAPQYTPAPCDLDLLTLKVVSVSHVTWAASVIGHSVLSTTRGTRQTDIRRQTDKRQTTSSLNTSA